MSVVLSVGKSSFHKAHILAYLALLIKFSLSWASFSMKIDARVDGVKYKTVSRKVDRPGYTFKQWFHNGQSVPITGIIHKQKSVASTFTWSVTESLKVTELCNVE